MFSRTLSCLGITLLISSHLLADTIWVPGDYPTIQSAIDAAIDGDTVMIAAGTYKEIDIRPHGKSITIAGERSPEDDPLVTLDGLGDGPIFLCDSSETPETILEYLIITNGYSFYSGGIDISGSSPTITDCLFHGNTGTYGGAIACRAGSNATIKSSTFLNNSASNSGGGLWTGSDSITLEACTFQANSAPTGGGMASHSTTYLIEQCTFLENEAEAGAAFFFHEGTGTVLDCEFRDNTSTFTAGAGKIWSSNMSFLNSTFSGNTAVATGGHLILGGLSNPLVSGCTFESGNSGYGGGGIHVGPTSSMVLSNTRTCGNLPVQIYGDYEDLGDNIVADECLGAGGCCHGETCSTMPDVDCEATGGLFLGLGTTCEYATCGAILGPCCVSSGCSWTTTSDCEDLGGDWLGEGLHCDDCPPPSEGDGDLDGDGDVDADDLVALRRLLALCGPDIDADGDTDINDLLELIAGYGDLCP